MMQTFPLKSYCLICLVAIKLLHAPEISHKPTIMNSTTTSFPHFYYTQENPKTKTISHTIGTVHLVINMVPNTFCLHVILWYYYIIIFNSYSVAFILLYFSTFVLIKYIEPTALLKQKEQNRSNIKYHFYFSEEIFNELL